MDENYVNKVELCGNVVRKIASSKTVIIIMAIRNSATQAVDFPQAFAFGEKAIKETEAVNVGDRVTISGHIQTTKNYTSGTIVIQNITKENSRLDSALEETAYKSDCNQVLAKGILSKAVYSPTPNLALATIKVPNGDNAYFYIPIVGFGNTAKKIAAKSVGDEITTLCYVKTSSGKTKQSFVVQGIK